jgi:hypothetical protein
MVQIGKLSYKRIELVALMTSGNYCKTAVFSAHVSECIRDFDAHAPEAAIFESIFTIRKQLGVTMMEPEPASSMTRHETDGVETTGITDHFFDIRENNRPIYQLFERLPILENSASVVSRAATSGNPHRGIHTSTRVLSGNPQCRNLFVAERLESVHGAVKTLNQVSGQDLSQNQIALKIE